jgi:Predicted metal binding domain
MAAQFVDPEVSRTKFEREIADYRSSEEDYRARGWLLLDATFPIVRVALCAARINPPAVITGVELDYTNYDERPPSVRLINPFTGNPYAWESLPTMLKRRVVGPPVDLPGIPRGADGQLPRMLTEQTLMQPDPPKGTPFLCVAGVREYHDHPAHSGDSWDLHRSSGAGRLVRILEVIDTYGVRPISGYNVTLTPQVSGFVQSELPE